MHHNFAKISSALLGRLQPTIKPQTVARSINKLSEQYMQFGKDFSQIWQDDDLVQGYLSYYMPLNLLRIKAVLHECQRLGFFEGVTQLIDVGSGPGTFDFALSDTDILLKKFTFVEKSVEAQDIHKKITQKLKLDASQRKWQSTLPTIDRNDLVVLSYSLSELAQLPDAILRAEALIIVEPSTQTAARNLQKLRNSLIENGFHILAPCTHHEACPLLTHSKTDWCHQRIHIEQSNQIAQIEAYLPMKNQTLTYSYLCARKTQPIRTHRVRVIGDTLYEKGKVRQAICRGNDREFLAWLTRHGEPEPIARGALIDLPESFEKKGEEIREKK